MRKLREITLILSARKIPETPENTEHRKTPENTKKHINIPGIKQQQENRNRKTNNAIHECQYAYSEYLNPSTASSKKSLMFSELVVRPYCPLLVFCPL